MNRKIFQQKKKAYFLPEVLMIREFLYFRRMQTGKLTAMVSVLEKGKKEGQKKVVR